MVKQAEFGEKSISGGTLYLEQELRSHKKLEHKNWLSRGMEKKYNGWRIR